MKDCIFCKIIKGEIPAKKRFEDDFVLAFDDISPVAPVHILIIPKKHITNLVAVSTKDAGILAKCQLAAAQLAQKTGISKAFRLLTANGREAGQSVFHLHYHLVGGWKDKSFKMETDPGGLRNK